MVGRLWRYQFGKIYREAVVDKSRDCSGVPSVTEENYANLSAVDIQTEIRSVYLSNISL
jgi:hypothetical protein